MKRLTLAALLLIPAAPAFAHGGHGVAATIADGFLHPFSGADHFFAMLAVGVWAAVMGGRARWALPAAFLCAMVAGSGAAQAGAAVFYVEHAILTSLIVLGLLLALLVRPPLAIGALVVAAFGLAHGYAHGVETPPEAVVSFTAGFAAATAVLHVAGLGMATALAATAPPIALRALGALTIAAGLALATLS